MSELTELQKKILDFFSIHPTATLDEAASELNSSYSSIQKQVKFLEDQRLLERTIMVSSKGSRFYKYLISLDTEYKGKQPEGPINYQQDIIDVIAAELRSNRDYGGVIYLVNADILIGGHNDVVLTVLTPEPDAVAKFVTSFLRTRNNIRATQTASVFINKSTS